MNTFDDYRATVVRAACLACLCLVMPLAAQDEDEEGGGNITNIPDTTADVEFTDMPANVEETLSRVLAGIEGPSNTVACADLTGLVAFVQVQARSNTPWRVGRRWEADCAAIMCVTTGSFADQMELNFGTNVPDYALLPCSMRYSVPLDMSGYDAAYLRCVAGSVPTNTCVSASFRTYEETTPNLQSGTSYSYTNLRTIVRANLGGTSVLLSYSPMQGKSGIAIRGLPVGDPQRHLYYCSSKTGTNIRGLNWVRPQMYVSKSLVVYCGRGTNEMAVAVFCWLRAGWKGLNVIRPHHIYQVLASIRDMRTQIGGATAVSARSVCAMVAGVNAMNEEEVNAQYALYCDYVKRESDKSGTVLATLYSPGMLRSLYDKKTLDALDQVHRRALIVQEEMRALLGIPTWSVTNTPLSVEQKTNSWKLW